MRSRGSSLPRSVCLVRALSPPPSAAVASLGAAGRRPCRAAAPRWPGIRGNGRRSGNGSGAWRSAVAVKRKMRAQAADSDQRGARCAAACAANATGRAGRPVRHRGPTEVGRPISACRARRRLPWSSWRRRRRPDRPRRLAASPASLMLSTAASLALAAAAAALRRGLLRRPRWRPRSSAAITRACSAASLALVAAWSAACCACLRIVAARGEAGGQGDAECELRQFHVLHWLLPSRCDRSVVHPHDVRR